MAIDQYNLWEKCSFAVFSKISEFYGKKFMENYSKFDPIQIYGNFAGPVPAIIPKSWCYITFH